LNRPVIETLLSGRPVQRVLLIRPSALGDVFRSVPVLVALRRLFPAARIDWLVQDSFADAVRAHPDLGGGSDLASGGGVLPFPRRQFGGATAVGALLRWLKGLSAQRYDVVVDAQGLFRSGLFARLTGAPVRVGHRDAREGAWLGYSLRVDSPPRLHSVDKMMRLLGPLGYEAGHEAGDVRPGNVRPGDMRLYSPAQSREWLALQPWSSTGSPGYAVLAPGSRWVAKRWPAERFTEVARWLLETGRASRVVLVGSGDERAQVGPLLEFAGRENRIVDLLGRTSVGQLMATIERAAVVVANDSAALHCAVGFARPLVALYGPTDVALVGPYGRFADVLQVIVPGDTLDHKNPGAVVMMERITTSMVTDRLAAIMPRERVST